jgi:nucleotide-binding universal stress UspA family protein
LEVDNVRLTWWEPTEAIVGFMGQHSSDLMVLATRGRDGIEHWLKGSVSEAVFRRSAIPALFIAHGARGFVSQVSGDIRLRRVLVPVDFAPAPAQAVQTIQQFGRLLAGAEIVVHLLHVGSSAPRLENISSNVLPSIMLRSGNVVKTIIDAAIEFDVDLIGMPTAGHHGVLDALRGSTTERVIRHAPCPVLAVPS